MEPLPPAGTRIRNAFNGETFIFTHVDEGASEFQCDIFIEVGGMKTGTGRQHLHPDADGATKALSQDGKPLSGAAKTSCSATTIFAFRSGSSAKQS